jgi:hypothetical protein
MAALASALPLELLSNTSEAALSSARSALGRSAADDDDGPRRFAPRPPRAIYAAAVDRAVQHVSELLEGALDAPLLLGAGDELEHPLLETYRLKRLLAKRHCNVSSNLSKALIHVPSGDLTHVPTSISAVRSFPVAGTFVGDAAACRADALDKITAQLRPVDHVMRLEDSEHVVNSLQLKFNLIRMCASKIFGHLAGSMPPDQTDAAAAHSDQVNHAAVAERAASQPQHK